MPGSQGYEIQERATEGIGKGAGHRLPAGVEESSLNYRPPAPEAILTTWIVQNSQGVPLPLQGGTDALPLT